MSHDTKFEKLLEPLVIRNMRIKNRMVKAPYSSTNADRNGYVMESAVYHYDSVARGGVGMFITESTAVDPLGVSGCPRMAIYDDSFIPGQSKLASVVHKYDCPIIMQLHHAGPSHSKGIYGAQVAIQVESATPVSSTSLTREQLPAPRTNLPRGLTLPEIQELVQKFAQAAARAQDAGFDGVELHFAYGYLMNSFFSRAWNRRHDEYGGEVKNRARFAFQVVEAVRQKVGEDFVVGVAMNAIEYNTPDGLTFDESQEIAKILETAGVDFFQISSFGYGLFEWVLYTEQVLYPEVPEGNREWIKRVESGSPLIDGAEAIKKVVSVPVMALGGISFQGAEKILQERKADLIGFGRAFIADPDFPTKLSEGRLDDINHCTHCMTCLDLFIKGEHEKCRVNASYAREKEMAITPTGKKKRVMVVGAGPAGMEAARVTAVRGHEVTLYESSPNLGGLLQLAALIKGFEVENLSDLIHYLQKQVYKMGVKVTLGKKVTSAVVQEVKPDAVIIATGSHLMVPSIPGINRSNVLTSTKLHGQVKMPMRFLGPRLLGKLTKTWLPVGKKVVIVGGLMHGCEVAEFLIKRGRQVTVTESSNQLGTGLPEINRMRLLEWLKRKGAILLTEVKYEEITDKGLSLKTKDGKQQLIDADTVLIATPPVANRELYDTLEGKVPEIYLVGDCREPRMIVDAIEEGRQVACAI